MIVLSLNNSRNNICQHEHSSTGMKHVFLTKRLEIQILCPTIFVKILGKHELSALAKRNAKTKQVH